MNITVTDNAVTKIQEILAEENNPDLKLRTFVQGGGCSGFQYGFTLDTDINEDDFVLEKGTLKILIDSMSYQYIEGATIDYKDELYGSQFIISNPNATTTCGCGSSFSV